MASLDAALVKCIYCGAMVDPSIGEGDHVILALLTPYW